MKMKLATLAILWLALCLAASACTTEYDFTRQPVARGSFGEEVYAIVHRDARWSPRDPAARRALLERERAALIRALDGVVPEALLRPLDALLRALGPLQDNDLVPELTRKLAGMLEATADQEPVHLALEARARREGYKGPDAYAALLEHAASWERLDELAAFGSRLVLDNDGFDARGGAAQAEPPTMTRLVGLLSGTLKDTAVTDDPRRVEVLAADLLLRSDRRLRGDDAAPAWAVRLDHRGLPRVGVNRRGNLYSPFTDRDGDGLADIDDLGRFVDFNGDALDAPAFGEPNQSGLLVRDGLGRAFVQDEGFVFEYVDLQQTPANFLMAQAPDFLEREVVFDLLDALQVLLPGRVTTVDPASGLTFEVYDPDNALSDLLYAVVQLLDVEALDELLETAAVLLRDHDDVLAALLFSLEDLLDRADASPALELTEGNTLADDLIAALAPVASSPELVEDLLVALQDPVVLTSAEPLADLLDFKAARAVPSPGSGYDACFRRCDRDHEPGTVPRVQCLRACPSHEILAERVDRAQGPGEGNRSHFERTLALFRTTAGVGYEMKVLELEVDLLDIDVDVNDLLPPLLRIDDAAAAYIQAVAGEFRLVDYITEEAVEDPAVDLLLDGLEGICGGGFFDSLVRALVPVLVNVTRQDLEFTCGRFEEVTAQTELPEALRKRQRLSIMVAFLSLLTDVAMDERPSAGQLARFFNSPNPSLDLSLARMSLSQIVDRDGYHLWEHHGDMLYAAEATGLLDALRPVFQVFVKHKRERELAAMMATLDQHYPTPEVRYSTREGAAAPRAGRGTGLVRFEEALRDWLLDDRLFPALHRLAGLSAQTQSGRGRSMNAVLAEVTAHAVAPDPALRYRDGGRAHRRADGRAVEPLNRLYVALDALNGLDARLEADPAAQAKWDRASGEVLDLVLEIDKRESGEAYFVREGGIALGQFATEILADVARHERDHGDLRAFVTQDLYEEADALITGRGLPLLVDLYNAATATPEDRALLKDAALHLLAPEGRRALLITLYELLVDLSDEDLVVTLARFLGDLLDPQRQWAQGARPLPLLSHGAQVLDETMARDPDLLALDLLRNAVTRDPGLTAEDGDPLGAAPVSALANVLRDYHRADPSAQGPLTAQDTAQISRELARWLLDDQRGMEQIYDLVKNRKKE
jgi:hypothetical protein